MKFQQFEASNIFSLDKVSLNLDNAGLVLVNGWSEDEKGGNGSGKSGLTTKGIIWALYGTTPHGLKADNVVNRHTGRKKAWARINFEDAQDRECTIYRQRNPNELSFHIDGVDISERKSVDTQEKIDKALGRNFETFIQTDFFGQGRANGYAQLTAGEQKKILEKILPIEQCTVWAQQAKDAIDKLSKIIGEIKLLEAAQFSTCNTLTSQYSNLEIQNEKWENDYNRKLVNLETLIQQEKGRYEAVHKELDTLKNKLNSLVIPQGQDISESQTRVSTALSALEETKDALQQATQSYNLWNGKVERFKNDILRTEIKNNQCPTCKQNLINPDIINQLSKQKFELTEQLKEASENTEQASKAVLYYKEEYPKAHKVWSEYEAVYKSLIANVQQANIINSQMSRLSEQLKYDKTNEYLIELDIAKKESNPYTVQMIPLEEQISEELAKLKEIENKTAKVKKELEYVEYWREVFGKDIKLKLFEAACPFLDERVKHYLIHLGNPQLNVQFSTVKVLATGEVKEEFQVKVWSDTGGEGIDSFSGGEGNIVDLAIGLALADLANSQTSGASNLLILDEPFSYLDERNSEAIVHYLTNVSSKSTIFLVSNDDNLKMLIPNRINVVKKNGISKIKEASEL